MKPHLLLYDLQEIVLVHFFLAVKLLLCESKGEENSTYTANAKQLTFTKERQNATGKRGKIAEKSWSCGNSYCSHFR